MYSRYIYIYIISSGCNNFNLVPISINYLYNDRCILIEKEISMLLLHNNKITKKQQKKNIKYKC